MPHRFRELKVWHKAMDLAVAVHRFTKSFPDDERFVLASQMRRAANSVPLNIAEGAGCRTSREFAQFLGIAYRSCNEVVTGIELAVRLEFACEEAVRELVASTDEVGSMLVGLMRKLDEK